MSVDDHPGSSDSLDAVVASYLQAIERGEQPDRAALVAAHPRFASQLNAFFADADRVQEFVPQGDDPLFAETIVPAASAPDTASPEISTIIGDKYKLIQQIGEGGMGTVYLAVQIKDVNRKVALKLIRSHIHSRTALARFEAERQALALMDHPNIAKFYDAGETPQGELYFVMELVAGKPLIAYCDEHCMPVTERIQLFVQICNAVQHAHQKGVIHRDLKPGNILVAEYDGKPAAKVIDFGLAKALDEPLTDRSLHTLFGQIVGTLQYMSPEQASFNQLDIDTRSDIYSLSVVLYELLTGSTPHSRAALAGAALDAQLRMIREAEPELPSRRLGSSEALPSIAAYRGTEPRRLSRLIRGELDLVLMKGLAKERDRRYGTPVELAADLERFLNREPVLAVRPTAFYVFRKFVRRNWVTLLMVLAFCGMIVAGGTGYLVQAFRSHALAEALQEEQFLKQLEKAKAEQAKLRADAQEAASKFLAREANSNNYLGYLGVAERLELERRPGWTDKCLELVKQASQIETPLRDDVRLRSLAAQALCADELKSQSDWSRDDRVRAAAYSQSGKLIAASFYNSRYSFPTVTLLDAETGKTLRHLSAPNRLVNGEVDSRFSIVYCGQDDDSVFAISECGQICRFDLGTNRVTSAIGEFDGFPDGYLTPDFKSIVIFFSNNSRSLECRDALTLEVTGRIVVAPGIDPRGLEFPSDRSVVLFHTNSGTFEYRLPTLELLRHDVELRGHPHFHAKGNFAIANGTSHLVAYRFSEGAPLHGLRAERRLSEKAAPDSLDGSLGLLSFSQSQRIFMGNFVKPREERLIVWDPWDGEPRSVVVGHEGETFKWRKCALSRQDDRVFTMSDHGIRQYSRHARGLCQFRTLGHPDGSRAIYASPSGEDCVVISEHRGTSPLSQCLVYRVMHSELDHRSGVQLFPNSSVANDAAWPVAWSPDGRRLAVVTSSESGATIQLVDAQDRAVAHALSVDNQERIVVLGAFKANSVAGLAWTRAGSLMAAIDYELFDFDVSANPPRLKGRTTTAALVARAPKYVALVVDRDDVGWAVTSNSLVRSVIATSGVPVWNTVNQIPGAGTPSVVAIGPDRRRLAIGLSDGSVILYDTATNRFGEPLKPNREEGINSICWLTPRRLACATREGGLSVVETNTDLSLIGEYSIKLRTRIGNLTILGPGPMLGTACLDEPTTRVFNIALIDETLKSILPDSAD